MAQAVQKLDLSRISEVSDEFEKLILRQKPIIKLDNWFNVYLTDSRQGLKQFVTLLKSDPSFKKGYENFSHILEDLKSIPVWLDLKEFVLPMNLYDLHYALIKNFKQGLFDEQLFDVQRVSLVSPKGPFEETPLIACLNQELIKLMTFHCLVKGQIPWRGTRLTLLGSILITLREGFTEQVDLHQLTERGIILKSDNEHLLELFGHGGMLKVFFNLDALADLTMQKSKYGNLYTTNRDSYFTVNENDVLKSLSFNSGSDNSFYLFIPYNKIYEKHVSKICLDLIKKVNSWIS